MSIDTNTTVLDLIRQFGVLNDCDRKRRGYELRGHLHLAGAFCRSVDFSSVY